MSTPSDREPSLLSAAAFAVTDVGFFQWDANHNADILTVSSSGLGLAWGPRKPRNKDAYYPPSWVTAATLAYMHSGQFQWDFVVEELAGGPIGVGFLLLWNTGPDWGFSGCFGESSTAWSFNPVTGDIVRGAQSIQGGLPTFPAGKGGTVTVRLDLPRDTEGAAWFAVNGTASEPIYLPHGAVIMPAACLMKEGQKITLADLWEEPSQGTG